MKSKEEDAVYIKWIFTSAYLYMLIPISIFICGYLKTALVVIFMPLVIISYFLAIKNIDTYKIPKITQIDIVKLIAIFVIISVWIYVSGIGGYSIQVGDTPCRNTIFDLLVKEKWPVHQSLLYCGDVEDRALCYYIGFWLPSAVVGKLFGMEAGWAFQLVWSVLGVYLCYLLICLFIGKVKIWPLIVFIFFGGADYIGTSIMSGHLVNIMETNEWWNGFAQYTSTGIQLPYVFNQTLPAWLATFLILGQKSNKNAIFLLGCLFISSLFPFIGLFAIAMFRIALFIIYNVKQGKIFWKTIREDLFTFQNVIGGGITGIITFLYYMSNSITSSISDNNSALNISDYLVSTSNRIIQLNSKVTSLYNNFTGNTEDSTIKICLGFILFVFLEVGIYFICLYKTNKKDPLYYFTIIILSLLPFIMLVDRLASIRRDFVMRFSVPFLIVVFLLVMKTLIKTQSKLCFMTLILTIVIGSFSTLSFLGSIYNQVVTGQKFEKIYTSEYSILTGGNFSGQADSFFLKKLCKELKVEDIEDITIAVPQQKEISGIVTIGNVYGQENGSWMRDRYVISINGKTDADLKLSCLGNVYNDAVIHVRVNGEEVGFLQVEGENRDSEISTIRSIVIDNKYLNSQGQMIELICDEPQTYVIDEETSSQLSMFIRQIKIEKY